MTEDRAEFLEKLKRARTKDFSSLVIPGMKLDPYPFQKNNIVSMAYVNGHLLTDATGLGKCLHGDSRISTSKGVLTAEELWYKFSFKETLFDGAGEWSDLTSEVLVHTLEASGKFTHAPLHKLYRQKYKGKLREIHLSDGNKILTTFEHKFLTDVGWSKDVNTSNYIAVPRLLKAFCSNNITKELAVFLAWLIAEGYEIGNTLKITQKDEKVLRKIKQLCKVIERQYKLNFKLNPRLVKYNKKPSDLIITSKSFKNFLESVGHVWGRRSAQKSIPVCIMLASPLIKREFLKAFFDAEASASRNQRIVEISSASPNLLQDISHLLRCEGIWLRTSIKHKMATNGSRIKRPYCVGVLGGESLRIFATKVGFGVSYKAKILKDITAVKSNTNVEVYPAKVALKNIFSSLRVASRNVGVPWVYAQGKRNPSKNMLRSFVKGLRNIDTSFLTSTIKTKWTEGYPSEKFFKQVLYPKIEPQVEYLEELLSQDLFWSSIKSIKEVDFEGYVYDFEVLGTHNYVANNIVCHNTVSTIGLVCFLKDRGHAGKFIIVANPAATRQWVDEVHKFSDLKAMCVVNDTNSHKYAHRGQAKRLQGYRDFIAGDFDVLVISYYNLLHDGITREKTKDEEGNTHTKLLSGPFFDIIKDLKYSVVFDEAQALKSIDPPSQTHKVSKLLAKYAEFRYGLTATPVTNTLVDLFAIFEVIAPGQLGTLETFYNDFCKFKKIKLKRGPKRTIDKLIGYKNLDAFKALVKPFYFGHRKSEVEAQLPKLIQKVIKLELEPKQREIYDLIAEGAIEALDLLREEAAELSGVTADSEDNKFQLSHTLAKMTAMQQAANSLELLKVDTGHTESSKVNELVRILKEDLPEDKVVVYSKFRSMIDIVERELKAVGIKSTRITGTESEDEKHTNMKAFQTKEDVKVCLITKAGSASINLQVAPYLICLDLPWSLGSLVQLIGRVHRIGSSNSSVVVLFLLAENTIDQFVWDLVKGKKELSDIILGGSDIGDLDKTSIKPENFLDYIETIKKGH